MKLILHGWYNEYTFWSKSFYSQKMPKVFEKWDDLAIIYNFFLPSYNSDLKAWRVGNIHIIYISLIIELKTSVIQKPVAGFENWRQVRTKNVLKGLIWYAWGLWQAFLSDFIEFWWKMFIKILKHSAIAL